MTSLLLSLALLASSADPAAFTLHAATGDDTTGRLERLGDGWAVTLGGRAVAGADLISLRRPDRAPPPPPHDRPHASFVNGDRLPGQLVAIDGDRARFAADLGSPQPQTLTVPLSALAAVWFTGRAARDADGADGGRPADKRGQDLVMLTNRDTMIGSIGGMDEGGPLRLEVAGRQTTVPRDRLRGLVFNTELARSAKPRGPHARLILANGARLTLAFATFDATAGTLTGRLPSDGKGAAPVRVPLAQVAALNILGGRAVYLSDLAPRRFRHTPYLGVDWPYRADQCVTGGDLRLAGGTYDKGLGVHSRCELTYAIPRGGRRFETLVGVDSAAGPRGSATVQVLVDGKPLLASAAEVNAGEPARELHLPLPAGGQELTLVVDFGRGGDVQDHVDWVEARIVIGG